MANKSDNVVISQKVIELAKKNERSLQYVARHIGLSKQGLYGMLDSDKWKVDTLYNIANLFDVNITYFFINEIA